MEATQRLEEIIHKYEAAMPLTDVEIEAITDAATRPWDSSWDELVDKIKAARGGLFPNDWFEKVIKTGTIPTVRGGERKRRGGMRMLCAGGAVRVSGRSDRHGPRRLRAARPDSRRRRKQREAGEEERLNSDNCLNLERADLERQQKGPPAYSSVRFPAELAKGFAEVSMRDTGSENSPLTLRLTVVGRTAPRTRHANVVPGSVTLRAPAASDAVAQCRLRPLRRQFTIPGSDLYTQPRVWGGA